MSDNNSSQVRGFLTAFAVGALMGAGMALLYAPRSGKETRDLLAQRTRELKNKAGDALDQAKETFLGKRAQITAAIEAGKEAMREQRQT
ncbi:MAG: YtxH domain-containing protein [Verrucomicrobia bacterium]|nr:YtxH domain-containing protein [Verrucomicrobiota bacterium]